LHAKRDLGALSFVVIRDRVGLAQVVLAEHLELVPETVLDVEGKAVAAAQAPGGVQLHEPSFRVLSQPTEPPPVELHRPTLKCDASHNPRLRAGDAPSPEAAGPIRARAASLRAFRAALDRLGFTEISTPKIVGSATERGLFRGLEIVTGGQRLHRYVTALAGATESLDGYLQAFTYGMPPHGGFALGLRPWVARLVGARNVRETTLFPRDLTASRRSRCPSYGSVARIAG
jgi:aspartyl/asparaginyl-tRNA synthetase